MRSHGPLSRIRWDRASRTALLVVLAIIAYLGISGMVSLLRSHAQAEAGLSQVHRLVVVNRHLLAEQRALHQRSTILQQARGLGMVKQGEQSYILTQGP